LTPLQYALQEDPSPAHAVRPPTGAPFVGVQVPTEPGASQRWHCPPQLELQHTPSTHSPLLHAPSTWYW
jgi:hypothetical protein